MSYTVTLRETDKKKVYVDPGIREGIYLYPGEIKKLKLLEGSMLPRHMPQPTTAHKFGIDTSMFNFDRVCEACAEMEP